VRFVAGVVLQSEHDSRSAIRGLPVEAQST